MSRLPRPRVTTPVKFQRTGTRADDQLYRHQHLDTHVPTTSHPLPAGHFEFRNLHSYRGVSFDQAKCQHFAPGNATACLAENTFYVEVLYERALDRVWKF